MLKIAHIHVWDQTNKGDLAIVISVQELLKSKFKNSKIYDFPIETLKDYDQKKSIKSTLQILLLSAVAEFFINTLCLFQKK